MAAIKQKLIIDKSLSNQFQIIVRDETGTYSPTNTTGYGGNNGSPVSMFSRYIFDITNVNTGESYRQIQSNDTSNPDEFYNPSIERIAGKENVILDIDNFQGTSYNDGVFKINMNLEINQLYYGEGYINTDTIVNVAGAKSLYENYQGIIVGNTIYYINSYENSTLILDRNITESFTSFKPILKTSETFVLNDKLNDCLNKKLSVILSNCDCHNNDFNVMIELQTLDWGLKRAIEREDYLQAKEYMDLLNKICNQFNCGCNNGCN